MRTAQVKTALFKKADSLFGPFLIGCAATMPSRDKIDAASPQSILIIRPGGIGDAVLLLPAVAALKKAYPGAKIDVLAEKRNAAIFLLCSHINKIILYDKLVDLASAFRTTYEIVIDTEQWHRLSAVVARLFRTPISIGYATNERQKLFSHPVPYSHDDYEVYSFINLVEPAGGETIFDPNRSFIEVPERYIRGVHAVLSRLARVRIIALFPGGSIEERKWGGDRFHKTAKLLGEQGYSIVVVGGKDDVQAGEEIVSCLSGALNLCGKLSLPETAAVLKESDLLITGDSGIMHIGYGLGIKVLALFGPGREKKWAPRGKNSRVINKRLSCSPCTTFGYTAKCKKNALCMRSISVEEVFREAMLMLGKE